MDEFSLSVKRDSRLVEKGDIFFDLAGNYEDGLKFSKEALSRGALKVVTERNYPLSNLEIVKDVREEYGKACAEEFGYPAKEMKLIGVTGTNGKTTCTHLIYEILKKLGYRVARVGTMGVHYADVDKNFDMTTPDVDILQR